MPSKVPTNIISVNIFRVTSWRRTKSYSFHGCFNFLNIYTTQCKWDFMLDASAIQLVQLQNANYILCWMLQLTQQILIQLQNTNEDLKWFERKQLQNECKYKKVGPTPLFCTKRPLAGNLYCSPSPPLYVAVIWSRIQLYVHILWMCRKKNNSTPCFPTEIDAQFGSLRGPKTQKHKARWICVETTQSKNPETKHLPKPRTETCCAFPLPKHLPACDK